MAESNRGPWIIAGGVVLAAIIVVVALVLLKDDPCDAWARDLQRVTADLREWREANPNLSKFSDVQKAHNAQGRALLNEGRQVFDSRPMGCDE